MTHQTAQILVDLLVLVAQHTPLHLDLIEARRLLLLGVETEELGAFRAVQLLRQLQRCLVVTVLDGGVGLGAKQQLDGLRQVAFDGQMKRRGAVSVGSVHRRAVVDQEVEDVQRVLFLRLQVQVQRVAVVLRVLQDVGEVEALLLDVQHGLQVAAVDGVGQVRQHLGGAAAARAHPLVLDVLGANEVLALHHAGVAAQLGHGEILLRHLVERVVAHAMRHQQLRRAQVVQDQGPDARELHAEFAVHARALDADQDAQVGGDPGRVGRAAVAALVVAWQAADHLHDALRQLVHRLDHRRLLAVVRGRQVAVEQVLEGVVQHAHPLLLLLLVVRLEDVLAVLRVQRKAWLLGHVQLVLALTGEQREGDGGRLARRVRYGEDAVGDGAVALLPRLADAV